MRHSIINYFLFITNNPINEILCGARRCRPLAFDNNGSALNRSLLPLCRLFGGKHILGLNLTVGVRDLQTIGRLFDFIYANQPMLGSVGLFQVLQSDVFIADFHITGSIETRGTSIVKL